ncbi:hypothetical protein [Aestuariicoccus sp. MJ-SS9]|uniref:hypothetical protein n=1 Tax=Aestuariicoccus sp. MJ-SS9 TaxID=3079855 RepID=UPI00290E2660|nr:hypothetical protein [Aestuariicoccus sp. MJ-SS9]MDU8913055.1 hypothetical protein [Aestuariicoccus sp. MJ-SS9]
MTATNARLQALFSAFWNADAPSAQDAPAQGFPPPRSPIRARRPCPIPTRWKSSTASPGAWVFDKASLLVATGHKGLVSETAARDTALPGSHELGAFPSRGPRRRVLSSGARPDRLASRPLQTARYRHITLKVIAQSLATGLVIRFPARQGFDQAPVAIGELLF